ncbi:MAG TPA: phosphopantetheine-binding protein [Acidobacteriota bacterium]|nr:phosphopantetheine-binding protein [Acidobacteriota bacterium]
MSLELDRYTAKRVEILGRVRRLLIDSLRVQREPDEIDPDAPLFGSGLGLDSLDAVELLVCLDADFGVKLPDDAFGRAEMRTVNSLVDLILAKEEADRGRG